MPPRNPGRALAGEQHVAERVAVERERRGWSYEQLARAMTNAGCPMNQSAMYKIEKGEPRRRITIDELMAFAQVFGTNVSDLLLDRSIGADAHAAKLFVAWDEAQRKADAAREAYEKHVGVNPDVVQRIMQAASERPAGDRG